VIIKNYGVLRGQARPTPPLPKYVPVMILTLLTVSQMWNEDIW